MSNEKAIAKIEKAATKGKSSVIIKLLVKGDKEIVLKSLEALGKIGDEDSRNHITHFLDHEDKEIRQDCAAFLTSGGHPERQIRFDHLTGKRNVFQNRMGMRMENLHEATSKRIRNRDFFSSV